jgi:hypothetical protein
MPIARRRSTSASCRGCPWCRRQPASRGEALATIRGIAGVREAIVPRDTASEQAASQQDAAYAVDAAASLVKPWLSGDTYVHIRHMCACTSTGLRAGVIFKGQGWTAVFVLNTVDGCTTLFGVLSSQVGRGHRVEENRIRPPSKHGLLNIVNRASPALDCGTVR